MTRCIRIPKHDAEGVRSRLFEEGLLDLGARIRSNGDSLLIPVLCDSYMGYEAEDMEMQVQRQRPTNYKEIADVPGELMNLLPSSFDVVGDVAMMKIPNELVPYAE